MPTKHNVVRLPHFKLKSINSDFVVDEVYLQPRTTTKDKALYTYLLVQKENLTTFQLLQILAGYFQCDVKEVSAAGLKDEQAITRQIVSIQTIISDKDIQPANNFFQNEELVISIRQIIGYGQEPIYPRKLHGNKFSVTIRDVGIDVAQHLEEYLKRNKFFTLINYYDEQRFGPPDSIHNTHLIGQNLLADNWPEAYREYLKSGNEAQEVERVKRAFARSQSYSQAMQAIIPSKLNFFISSYNSFLWNSALNDQILQLDDVVRVELPYIGVVSLPACHPAPIPGMFSIEVEQKNWQTGQNVPRIKERPVVLNIPVYLLAVENDKLHPHGKQAITVAFYLPTGCYATMLVKQLLLAAV